MDGNGQSQLAQMITGVISPEHGEVLLHAKKIAKFIPGYFIASGVSHIPEDRNKMGLIGTMSVKENLVLKRLEKPEISLGKGLFLKNPAMVKCAENMKDKYDIRCESIEQETRNLSGGNQQKIILARELEENPDLLVAVHPTRGLDVGATRFVHEKMLDSRDNGCGVLLISADFDEVLKLSDRLRLCLKGR